jgi:regulator of sirC expression with transglutaminase-like and TPR domain
MVLDGDGAEVDWSVGYDPPAEKFQASLQKMSDGVETFKALSAAYAKNPKDVAIVFNIARKWSERYNEEKAIEKYKEVTALDPKGTAGTYTQEYTKITVPYTEFAEFSIATAKLMEQKPDMAPIRAFIGKYPKSKLVKQAYGRMAYYYGYQASKEEAAKFFADYAGKYPNDPMVLYSWLSRINRDKEPIDKGIELAAKIEELTDFNPEPGINQLLAQVYTLKGDKAKAEELYGKTFMENQVSSFAYGLVAYSNYWLGQDANKESALAMAETALKLEPDNSYILQQAANAYVKSGKEAKALELYGPAFVKKNAADATSLYSYAGFWARQGKNLNDALAAAKKSVELMPGAYYAWSTLSLVHEKMKNYPEAIKAKEKAVELAPDTAKETFKKDLEKLKAAAPGKK